MHGPRILAPFIGPLLALVWIASAAAAPRDDTLALLDTIRSSAAGPLDVRVNDGDHEEVRIGEKIVFRFRSPEDGYLTVVYLDAHGAATLLFPRKDPEAGRIQAGVEATFPRKSANFQLEARLPLGFETVYAIATPEPISLDELGSRGAKALPVFDAQDAPQVAKQLASLVAGRPGVRVGRFDQRVVGKYTTRGIVEFFTTRHRSIRRPRIDLDLKFDFDSVDLSEVGQRELGIVGEALNDPKLSDKRFRLSGHTDDQGDPEYNRKLSARRAHAARQYLTERYGIDPKRLVAIGFGEDKPIAAGSDSQARAMNRRVELELER